ncbi:MAG: hypothetical protein ACRDRZ_03650 [Pseudonocardiaceae bacterium]
MALTRVARTAAATLTHTFEVGDQVTDSSTTVTVSVVDAGGAAVSSGNATSAGAGTGRYTYALPGQASLGLLTASWSGTIAGAAVVETGTVEIAGGFFFGLARLRNSDTSLGDPAQYTADELALARLETEVECETICDRAFVPRYGRVVLNGTGTTDLVIPDADLRTVRAARISPAAGEAYVELTAGELAALQLIGGRELRRADGEGWTLGTGNVLIEYEHGLDAPPEDLRRAALVRARTRLNIPRSGIPDRATSFTVGEGGTFRLDLPGPYKTGLPDVDAVYGRYSLRSGAGGRKVPASRPWNLDPQYGSLFHGGTR